MKNIKYLNFPIQLLDGFLLNSRTVLLDIYDYAIYAHTQKLKLGDYPDKLSASVKFYGLDVRHPQLYCSKGEDLYRQFHKGSPKVGISITMYMDFFNNHKTEFEKVSLLGFLAIKSILGQKPYCKVTNNYWLARMDGKAETCELSKLSQSIYKYRTIHYTCKIKGELERNWNLVTYSRYIRGFYISYKLTLKELVRIALNNKTKYLEKKRKETHKKALEDVTKEFGSK